MSSRIYNVIKQSIDNRDYTFIPQQITNKTNHYITDNPIMSSPILNQGNIGSCLANAVYSLLYILSNGRIQLSRLHLYLCCRACDNNNLSSDTGGTIRGIMAAILKYGASNETLWPYVPNNFNKLSPSSSFTKTYPIKNFVYSFVSKNINTIKNTLALSKPIILGIQVYESFETLNSNKFGVIPIPDTTKEKLLGGHAILLVGYDDNKQVFKFQNSWGTNWGDKGYGYIPYNYVINNNLAFDLCTVSFNI